MHLKMSSAKWRPLCLGLNECVNCFYLNRRWSQGMNDYLYGNYIPLFYMDHDVITYPCFS